METRAAANVLELIGKTPLLRLRSFDIGECELYVKLESQNPGGSIKDRIGKSMIEAAEAEGRISSGGTLIEATAGNTGLGLALVASQRGYRCVLVVPDKMSREKVMHLQALGATIITTRSDVGKGHPAYYQDLARKIANETTNSFFVNQFDNPANPRAHYETTGPEIFEQTKGRIDTMVCGVGSGGTITGLSRYFAERKPSVEIVLADPVGSVLANYVETGEIGQAGSWLVEGIGEDFVPPIADLSRVHAAYRITDRDSMATARKLLKDEGVFAGSSSGTLVAAAAKYCQDQATPKVVVTLICDTGAKYLSKVHNQSWLAEAGMIDVKRLGDIRDLISHKTTDGQLVSLAPDDLLSTAYARMRLYDVSQLPVLADGTLVGIIDESDLLLATRNDPNAFATPVTKTMTRKIETLPCTARIDDVLKVLDRGLVAVVADELGFHGLITRVDALNYLRQLKDNR